MSDASSLSSLAVILPVRVHIGSNQNSASLNSASPNTCPSGVLLDEVSSVPALRESHASSSPAPRIVSQVAPFGTAACCSARSNLRAREHQAIVKGSDALHATVMWEEGVL